jgi:hypothetical protein
MAMQDVDAIEREIAAIRADMDRTVGEIEFRLSPGQLAGGAGALVRDVFDAGSTARLARAIRHNPVPVALIAIGFAWLGVATLRTTAAPSLTSQSLPPAETAAVLSGLLVRLRPAVAALASAEPRLSSRIDAVVAEVEAEIRACGGTPTADCGRAWQADDIDAGLAGLVDTYAEALRRPLPDELRVVLGAHFHGLRTAYNRRAQLQRSPV